MSEHAWSWTVETNFPSRLGAHDTCVRDVLAALERLGWSCSDLFAIQMALEESLTNAIRHGNRHDEAKLVRVECKASPERFWLKVADEGPGFKPEDVPDCTAEENLDRCGGRGLALIKAYMTRVEYNACGNCVTMEKQRTAE
jgi:serine/threonine-protein kinase RsbW